MTEGSAAPGVAQTSALISGARDANVNIGNRVTGAPVAEKDTAAIAALQARLEKHIPPEGVQHLDATQTADAPITEKPKSLDDLTWHMVSEPPKDSPAAPHEVLKEESQPTQKKVDLDAALTESLQDTKNTPDLGTLLQAAKQTTRSNSEPDEIKAFTILAHHDLGGRTIPANTELIPAAFTALRGGENGAVAFHGMDAPYPSQKAADVIIEQALKVSRGPKTQDDLDRMVEVSLACGNPFAAVDLMQKASKLITKPDDRSTDSSFSRLAGKGGVFDEARKLYHNRSTDSHSSKLDDRMDGVLASIGEGPLEQLKKSPEAMAVQKDAETRLRGNLIERRDGWYNAQKVSHVEARQQQLDDAHIEAIIEEAAASGNDWKSIDATIAQRVEHIEDGKMANFIAAELQRRLYSELSIERQMQKAKADARGDYQPAGNNYVYGTYNMLENAIYQRNRPGSELTSTEKTEKVNALGTCNETRTQKALLEGADTATLVQVLRQPDLLPAYMNQIDLKIQRGELSFLKGDDLLKLKQKMADKLVAGTGFLQAVADNTEGRKILETEFGFREIADPGKLEKAQEELQKTFPNEYDEAAEKSQGTNEEQAHEDARMMAEIGAVKKQEVELLTTKKIAAAKSLVPRMHDRLDQQYQILIIQQEALREPLAQQAVAQQALARLESEKLTVEKTQTVTNRLKTWFPANANAGAITEADQKQKLAEIASQAEMQNKRLKELEGQIASLGGVKKDELAALSKRLSDLKKLIPQESTPIASET